MEVAAVLAALSGVTDRERELSEAMACSLMMPGFGADVTLLNWYC